MAVQSSDSTISGATKILTQKKFPAELLIFGENYLQSVLYSDSVSGLQWYIIVLLPAMLDQDHIGPDDYFYDIVITLATLALTINIIFLVITLYFWKYKIVRLTQPFFTVL